jgi:hypothetical protein
MSGQQEAGRVLARVGSRLLSKQEQEQVAGGVVTRPCTFDPRTCKMDGDCEPPIRCPL